MVQERQNISWREDLLVYDLRWNLSKQKSPEKQKKIKKKALITKASCKKTSKSLLKKTSKSLLKKIFFITKKAPKNIENLYLTTCFKN